MKEVWTELLDSVNRQDMIVLLIVILCLSLALGIIFLC